jgi:replicative DNA helicase
MSEIGLVDIYDEQPPPGFRKNGEGCNDQIALHNDEAEQMVIGALLADSASYWPLVRLRLRAGYFFEPVHARIYEAIDSLAVSGKVASPVTVKGFFEQDEGLTQIGGASYLTSLARSITPPVSISTYVDIVSDLAVRRAAIAAGRQLIASASTINVEGTIRPAIAAHVGLLQRIFDEGSERKTSFTLGEAMSATVERVKRMRAGDADPNAISTGIGRLDKFIGGFHCGEYAILGGRPSMGKTALATQIAYNVAERGGGVFYASLEMPVAVITPRFASCRLWSPDFGINYQRILRGEVDDREERWLESAAEELKTWPLIIDDAAGLSAAELEARAQITKAKFERTGTILSLIVVDHIHKMHHPKSSSPAAEYTAISGRLAEMAKRLNVPVLALAQLNRGPEGRDDKRPQLSDLRESGSIEQDADTVLFVYRPVYYLERKRCSDPNAEADRMAGLGAVANRLELIIEKQRSGPIGTIDLWCNMATNVVRDPGEVDAGMGMAA